MQRRQLLRAAAAAGAAWVPIGRTAFAAVNEGGNAALPGQRRLIVVFLRGAVDGLSIVTPYAENEYYQARSGIALQRPGQAGGVLDLDGHFGLNPALAPLMPLWQGGRLAFVQAAGSADTTRSHFDAQDYMESGTPGRKGTPDGWLNRLLGTLPPAPQGQASTTRGVSVGAVLPRIWSGRNPVANIASGAASTKPTLLDRPQVAQAFDSLYNGNDSVSQAYRQSQSSRHEMVNAMDPASMAREEKEANNGAPLPNGFPGDAQRLATLMRRDSNVQIAFMALGGWDTHANQGGAQGQLSSRLQPLGQGLAELANGLGPTFNDTTVLVISEFGRTLRQNGTGGTDHGHGNVMWVMGGNVAGGKVYGQWPGLQQSALYEGRDLAVTTDFRAVLAGVCERQLRLPDSRMNDVFPAFGGPGLNTARA